MAGARKAPAVLLVQDEKAFFYVSSSPGIDYFSCWPPTNLKAWDWARSRKVLRFCGDNYSLQHVKLCRYR